MTALKQSFGLVRDKNGIPRIDYPETAHPAILVMMTPQERENLGIWPEAFALDAQGRKRVRIAGGQLIAKDALNGVTDIYVGTGEVHTFPTPRNFAAGAEIDIKEH